MICCQRVCTCDYCPCCGRYLGSVWPIWPRPWRPWGYPPPYYPRPLPGPQRPFYDAGNAIREGRAAVGAR